MLSLRTLSLTALAMSAMSITAVARPTAKIELRLQTTNLNPATPSPATTPNGELSNPFDFASSGGGTDSSHVQAAAAGSSHIRKRLTKRCLSKKSSRPKSHGRKITHHKKTHHSHSHTHHHHHHHHSSSHASFQSGQGTYYDAGLGACGGTNSGTDLIAAISKDVYDQYTVDGNPNNNALCNKYVEAKYGSHTVKVKVVDRCVGCAAGDLDFSRSAFAKLAPMALGRIAIKSKWLTGPLAH